MLRWWPITAIATTATSTGATEDIAAITGTIAITVITGTDSDARRIATALEGLGRATRPAFPSPCYGMRSCAALCSILTPITPAAPP
jgi:hypothetical protein